MSVAIQVRNVPEATRDALAAEAEERGVSLQLFLADVLEREAASARNRAWVRSKRNMAPMFESDGTNTRELIREGWDERMRNIYDALGWHDLPTR
jgi:hypothetical protein